MESSDDAIVSKDLNGVVTSWNKAAERIFGYTAQEVVGQSILLIIPPDLQDQEPEILSKIRAGQRIEHFETVRVHKNGTKLDISLTISPIRDPNGTIIGAAKIARDVTRQRLAERAAFHLAAIVESSDDAIISKDLNGVVTSWNKAAQRIFGYTAQEIVGQPILLIIPPELHKQEPEILSKIRAGQRIEHFETVRVHKNGTRVDISLTISPMKDEEGNIIGAAKIARDITEQNRMMEALHTSERLASVGRLAATVAHEINNPLEAITNFIYLAKQQKDLPEKARRYLTNADHELRRVAHIAQQTLGFYRDSNQDVRLVVADLVDAVLTIYERKFQYKGVRIHRRIEPGLVSHGSPGEIKQILSNLIANAIDASSVDGEIVICARRWCHPSSRVPGVRYTIADNGVGIAPEDKHRIFAPFFTTKKDVGTGLGLWISRDLLRKKAGYIRLRSRQTKPSGTTVSFFVPDAATVRLAEAV